MSNRIPERMVILIAFLLALVVYWPALHGLPIWDDVTFWFSDRALKDEIGFATIWKNYSWPFSVSLQKILLGIFGEKYFYYHLLNVVIHFINALLVLKLGKVVKLKYPIFLFLLFLFHPTAVISTAWMIQLKTLICFTLGLASLLVLLTKGFKLKWLLLSTFLFFLSVASKSASLPLAFIFIFVIFREFRFSRIYLFLPFLVVALIGGYRLLKSPVTKAGVINATELHQMKDEEAQTEKNMPEKRSPDSVQEEVSQKVNVQQSRSLPIENNSIPFSIRTDLVLQTLNYYFWQSVVPVSMEPVKGTNLKPSGLLDYIHLFFIIALVILFWRDVGLYYLIFSHLLLLPFLGLIPAPYMNVTWVSDQHLYLALPALLAFWLRLLEKVNFKYFTYIPFLFLFYFIYKARETTPYYRDSFAFYEKSLEANPFNVPIIYNLAIDRIYSGELEASYKLLEKSYEFSQYEPSMKESSYFPHLVQLYLHVRHKREKNEN